jgi:hypothetical protein
MPKRSYDDLIGTGDEGPVDSAGRYQKFVDDCRDSLPKRSKKDEGQLTALELRHRDADYSSSPSTIDNFESFDDIELLSEPLLIPWTHKHKTNPLSWSDLHPTELHSNQSMLEACMYVKLCEIHHPQENSVWASMRPGYDLTRNVSAPSSFNISSTEFDEHCFGESEDSDISDIASVCSSHTEDGSYVSDVLSRQIGIAESMELLHSLDHDTNSDDEDDAGYIAELEAELEQTTYQLQKWAHAFISRDEDLEMEEGTSFGHAVREWYFKEDLFKERAKTREIQENLAKERAKSKELKEKLEAFTQHIAQHGWVPAPTTSVSQEKTDADDGMQE